MTDIIHHFLNICIWGFVATAAMTSILQGSQALGLSRLSFPFLFGVFFTANRHYATALGFVLYMLGGFALSVLYYLIFDQVGFSSWWLGILLGFLHGIFLLTVALPMLPHFHPRIATEYAGPTSRRRIEPPGFLGFNYGRLTPLVTLLAQVVYGGILGAFFDVGLPRM